MNTNDTQSVIAIPRRIVILCLLISLVGIADHDLWTPDEPREAAIMLSMSRTGNLVVPSLAGVPFVEKPPLYYIVGAGMLRLLAPVLGATTALRLSSALWGLGALLMTWLLARRLLGREQGILAMALLATMPGFIYVTHWLLVDNALLFFVTAALWCFAEAYLGQRPGFLPWAALFTGGAFLSKGFIGPVIIMLGWTGLFFSWGREIGWRAMIRRHHLAWHSLALLICLGLMLGWILALRQVGGQELWDEWFWDNHFGRFSGKSTHLGHIRPPWYYLPIIPVYLLPWLAIILAGILNLGRAIWRRQMTAADRMLAGWALGGFLLLSLTATKRDIYLSVLLPSCAIIGAEVLQSPLKRWLRNWSWLWGGSMIGALLVFAIAPLLGARIRALTGAWGWPQALAGLTALGCFLLLARAFGTQSGQDDGQVATPRNDLKISGGIRRTGILRRSFIPAQPLFHMILAATALFYVGGLTILFPFLDKPGTAEGAGFNGKSYQQAFRAMADAIDGVPSARVAGWRFDETTHAGFYYYCDRVFPEVADLNELERILNRTHPEFNGILALSRHFPPRRTGQPGKASEPEQLPPWHVRKEVKMGQRRILQWIEGITAQPEPD